MDVIGAYCYHCENYIYSRSRHDMIGCECSKGKMVAIDGGQSDYVKVNTGEKSKYKILRVGISASSEEELVKDWNEGHNKYGKIKNLNINREILKNLGGVLMEDLEHLSYYIGICRNAKVAIWDGKEQKFFHTRYKMGKHIIDSINHPEMDDGYDLFIPLQKVSNPNDLLPEGLSGLRADKIFPKYN